MHIKIIQKFNGKVSDFLFSPQSLHRIVGNIQQVNSFPLGLPRLILKFQLSFESHLLIVIVI